MRLTLTALGHTWLDLRVLEDDDEDQGGSLDTAAERSTGEPPFGFRPTPDPWPPSWE